jgi:hypothetical protein
MDQQNQTGPQGPAGRRLHIAHRRSPSEMTPLMSMYLTFIFATPEYLRFPKHL